MVKTKTVTQSIIKILTWIYLHTLANGAKD